MLRLLILVWVLTITPAVGDSSSVTFDGERLSVDFRSVALRDALEQIAAKTGITFQVDPGVTGSLSARFQDLPLDRAMSRLLRSFSHVLLYESTGNTDQVSRIMILAEGSQQTVFPPPEPAEQEEQPSDEEPPPEQDEIPADQQSNFLQPGTVVGEAPLREVRLRRDPSGHFTHAGRINGRAVTFLIDTGATAVALPESLAGSLGIVLGSSRSVFTAAGPTLGYQAELEVVEMGQLSLENVDAIILPGLNATRQVLLGMSFLARFELQQREDILLIRELR